MMSFLRNFADSFIAQGDYNLPFRFIDYMYKNFFLWSFQAGAANLDGILRIPGRLIVVAVFGIMGNLVASYFYLGFSYALVAVSFFVFLRYFLKIRSAPLLFVLTLLVLLSPAFLGNTAKVGLVAAAGLLPMCLFFAKRFFQTNKFVYLFGIILCLNYSLIHPFNFTINVILTLSYILYLVIRYYRSDIKQYCMNIILGGLAAFLMSLYFLLPVIAIGSIDKSVLSQDITTEPTDYSGIINIANAGDPISAFTLSKHIFLDFNYYSDFTYIPYTIGLLALYGLIVGLFCIRKNFYTRHDIFIFAVAILFASLFIFMSSGHTIASWIFQQLVSLPGGWIFRSPLKWQLYVPLFLLIALAIQIKYIPKNRIRLFTGTLAIIMILQSGYLLFDISQKLLSPRSVTTFHSVQDIPDGDRLLYLTGSGCANYLKENPKLNTELNQVISSKQIQVKKTSQLNRGIVRINDFDYVIVCKENGEKLSNDSDVNFKLLHSINNGSFRLYENTSAIGQARSLSGLYRSGDQADINAKSAFMHKLTGSERGLIESTNTLKVPTVTQLFNKIEDTNVVSNRIATTREISNTAANIYSTKPVYYQQEGNIINLTSTPKETYTRIEPKSPIPIKKHSESTNRFIYHGDSPIRNTIDNGSFENGPWTKNVQDCFDYDDKPDIRMRIAAVDSQSGKNHLELTAARHVACTSKYIKVHDIENLLLSFRFKSIGSDVAGYSLVFDNNDKTAYGSRPRANATSWQSYSNIIRVPAGAQTAKLTLLGYPKDQTIRTTTSYDNVAAFGIDAAMSDLYMVQQPDDSPLYSQSEISSSTSSPTEKIITLKKAHGNQIVVAKDTFNQNWELLYNNKKYSSITQTRIDNYNQGWVIDVDELCKNTSCSKNSDGTYNLTFNARYRGQDMVVVGSIISFVTFVTISIFLIARKFRSHA